MSTARNSLADDSIFTTVHAFYSYEAIREAKEVLSNLCDVKGIRRKGEKKLKNEIEDIQNLFDTAFDNKVSLPKFVADNYNSLPPSSGFECLANRVIILTNEIDTLNREIQQFNLSKDNFNKGLDDCLDIKQDISDIKKMLLQNQRHADSIASNINKLKEDCLPRDFLRPPQLFDDDDCKKTYASVLRYGEPSPKKAIQPAKRTRPQVITGTVPQTTTGGFRCAVSAKHLDIFIGRCDLEVAPQEILDYCKRECNITPIDCVQMETRSVYYKSFKLTVSAKDRDGLLASDKWPEGIVVQKFFNFNRRSENRAFKNVQVAEEQHLSVSASASDS